jgi:hypothetical protein
MQYHGCTQFRLRFPGSVDIPCCDSCHDDAWEEGYAMCYVYLPDCTYEICCTLAAWYDENKNAKGFRK